MQRETIDWIDHFGSNTKEWHSRGAILERIEEDMMVRTHGVVLFEDENRVLIASAERIDVDLSSPLYQDWSVIYKKLITNREVYHVPRERPRP
tara:strand:- start:2901 stop:3179 length:279 start_codon:yes stop_codon:yes gene_type:complete